MMKEVRRNTWARFLKKFSVANRYRYITVSVSRRGKARTTISENIPLMGLGLSKEGRFIDGIELFAGQWSPEQLNVPAVSVKRPVKLFLDGKAEMDNLLVVEGEDGSKMEVRLDANRAEPRSLVEKIAYTLSERRGFAPGGEVENWLEAERTLRQLEDQLA